VDGVRAVVRVGEVQGSVVRRSDETSERLEAQVSSRKEGEKSERGSPSFELARRGDDAPPTVQA
jgi:hypothetical protein